MNQIRLNEFGLADLLAEKLRQMEALANAAHYMLSNIDASVYLRDAAELMAVISNLSMEAERLRAEWQQLIPRHVYCVCVRGIK